MSANFDSVTKYLDRSPASIDTTHVTKPSDRRTSRAIKKINYTFTIPQIQLNAVTLGAPVPGCLVHQLNFTAPLRFKILSMTGPPLAVLNRFAFIAIRYRVGTTVYRYRLPLTGYSAVEALFDNFKYVQGSKYTNQPILANFAIEIWTILNNQTNINLGPFVVTTGLLRNPVIPEETSDDIDASETLARADLEKPMPEALPVAYGDSSCWLTN